MKKKKLKLASFWQTEACGQTVLHTRQVNFNRTTIGGECQNWNILVNFHGVIISFCVLSFQYLSPVSGSEAAMRSRARLSSRLRSVPEKHSLLSFVQDIRRKGLESERRVSTAGSMMCTTTVPVPIVPLQSSSNKNTLEPGEASSIVVKRRGTFPTHFLR